MVDMASTSAISLLVNECTLKTRTHKKDHIKTDFKGKLRKASILGQ